MLVFSDLLTCLQIVSAVVHFPSVQGAVDTTVQILQCGIPIARLGMYLGGFIACSLSCTHVFIATAKEN